MRGPEAYFALLRAALWGAEIPDGQEILPVLEEILQLAEQQTTRGLIYDLLLRRGPELPPETATRMQQLLFSFLSRNRQLDMTLSRVATILHQAGISCVLLKGQGVAHYYPVPTLRECGDIDLYIGPERLEEARQAISPLADRMDDALIGPHLQLWIGQTEIELHIYTMIPPSRRATRFYRTLEAEGLRHGLVPQVFAGASVDTPEDTFNAFYLFYHTWYHFRQGGIGLRQLCDWMLLLHARRDRIDRDRLLAMLQEMQLLEPWRVFGCIVVRNLGLPQEEFPFYEGSKTIKYRRVLSIILSEGNFGRGRKVLVSRPRDYLGSKAYSFLGYLRRFFLLLPLFPHDALCDLKNRLAIGFRQVFKDLSHNGKA